MASQLSWDLTDWLCLFHKRYQSRLQLRQSHYPECLRLSQLKRSPLQCFEWLRTTELRAQFRQSCPLFFYIRCDVRCSHQLIKRVSRQGMHDIPRVQLGGYHAFLGELEQGGLQQCKHINSLTSRGSLETPSLHELLNLLI